MNFNRIIPFLYLRSISLFCFSLISALLKLLCCPFKEQELYQESWMKNNHVAEKMI